MSVSIWQHILVVLALLATNTTTFTICKRRIETLRMALIAKRVLLGYTGILAHDKHLLAGETLTFKDDKGNTLTIKTSSATHLDVRIYSR